MLIGGGVGVGLIVAWAAWPRVAGNALPEVAGTHRLGGWLRVGEDGRIGVAVPLTEAGQGVYTTLPQIVADEVGADWAMVGVEAAPLTQPFANPLFTAETVAALGGWRATFGVTGEARYATGGGTAVRGFEARLRDAGATARALLCVAAADSWGVDWRECNSVAGFVVHQAQRLPFGTLAVAAAGAHAPRGVAWRRGRENRLTAQSLLRLDAPPKVDGSAQFAADIRLPDMLYAAIAQALPGGRLVSHDAAAARRVAGVVAVTPQPEWVAVVAVNSFAARQGVAALDARFTNPQAALDDAAIARALDHPDAPVRHVDQGDADRGLREGRIVRATYRAAAQLPAPLEPPAATAQWRDGRVQIWMATTAPARAKAAIAAATGVATSAVAVHPLLAGGSFGTRGESAVATQAALIARAVGRPVQLAWSRAEAMRHEPLRPPTRVDLAGRLHEGRVTAYQATVATPSTLHQVEARVWRGDAPAAAMRSAAGKSAPGDVAGAAPPYAIAAVAVDHAPVGVALVAGSFRGGADATSVFARECFVDELAAAAHADPFGFRIAMLGNDPRLAAVLARATVLGGWGDSVGQGLACHVMQGSRVAIVAQAVLTGDRVHVERLTAVADVGRVINPAIVRQQIQSAMLMGMATATGAPVRFHHGQPQATLRTLRLPLLADLPDVTVELVVNNAAPGGVHDLALAPTAAAIANAVSAATGTRARTLPLVRA